MKELSAEVESLMKAFVNNFPRNVKRGACLLPSFENESGPMGFSPICCDKKTKQQSTESSSALKKQPLVFTSEGSPIKMMRNVTDGFTSSSQRSEEVSVSTPRTVVSHATKPVAAVHAPHTARADGERLSKIFPDVTQSGGIKFQEPTEEWKLVQKKRFRNRFLGKTGKAIVDENTNFKAADIKTAIYIYNVSTEASVCDIKAYKNNKTNLDGHLEKMNMKTAKVYNAYIVYVPTHKIDMFLKDDFWPNGILYRRYVNFSRNVAERTYRELATKKPTTN